MARMRQLRERERFRRYYIGGWWWWGSFTLFRPHTVYFPYQFYLKRGDKYVRKYQIYFAFFSFVSFRSLVFGVSNEQWALSSYRICFWRSYLLSSALFTSERLASICLFSHRKIHKWIKEPTRRPYAHSYLEVGDHPLTRCHRCFTQKEESSCFAYELNRKINSSNNGDLIGFRLT